VNTTPNMTYITERSLDHLGALLNSPDDEKALEGMRLIRQTPDDALVRLYRAAIKRFTKKLPVAEVAPEASTAIIAAQNINALAVNALLDGSPILLEMAIERHSVSGRLNDLLLMAIMTYETTERPPPSLIESWRSGVNQCRLRAWQHRQTGTPTRQTPTEASVTGMVRHGRMRLDRARKQHPSPLRLPLSPLRLPLSTLSGRLRV
jgi:hypothetical protein